MRKMFLLLILLVGVIQAQNLKYDWRQTTWYGATAGIISGNGLTVEHWGEKNGFRVVGFVAGDPFDFEGNSDYTFSCGGSLMRTIGNVQPESIGNWGFSSIQPHLFVASSVNGELYNYRDGDLMLFASVGIGVNLNRRDSRLGLRLGIGPWQDFDNQEFNVRPTVELSWVFGTPRSVTP